MHFTEKPTNTAARGSNNANRSRWRDEGVDPIYVGNPYDMVVGSEPPTFPAEPLPEVPASARPPERDVSAQVAERVANMHQYMPSPALQAVQRSFR